MDDFFAKKDKSKKKTKSSKFTVDDILQAKVENEEKSKKVRSSKKKEKDANRSDKTLGVKTEEVIFFWFSRETIDIRIVLLSVRRDKNKVEMRLFSVRISNTNPTP